MIRAQLISIVTYAIIAWWYVVPRLNKLDKRAPLILISLPLMIWQFYVRRGQTIETAAVP